MKIIHFKQSPKCLAASFPRKHFWTYEYRISIEKHSILVSLVIIVVEVGYIL